MLSSTQLSEQFLARQPRQEPSKQEGVSAIQPLGESLELENSSQQEQLNLPKIPMGAGNVALINREVLKVLADLAEISNEMESDSPKKGLRALGEMLGTQITQKYGINLNAKVSLPNIGKLAKQVANTIKTDLKTGAGSFGGKGVDSHQLQASLEDQFAKAEIEGKEVLAKIEKNPKLSPEQKVALTQRVESALAQKSKIMQSFENLVRRRDVGAKNGETINHPAFDEIIGGTRKQMANLAVSQTGILGGAYLGVFEGGKMLALSSGLISSIDRRRNTETGKILTNQITNNFEETKSELANILTTLKEYPVSEANFPILNDLKGALLEVLHQDISAQDMDMVTDLLAQIDITTTNSTENGTDLSEKLNLVLAKLTNGTDKVKAIKEGFAKLVDTTGGWRSPAAASALALGGAALGYLAMSGDMQKGLNATGEYFFGSPVNAAEATGVAPDIAKIQAALDSYRGDGVNTAYVSKLREWAADTTPLKSADELNSQLQGLFADQIKNNAVRLPESIEIEGVTYTDLNDRIYAYAKSQAERVVAGMTPTNGQITLQDAVKAITDKNVATELAKVDQAMLTGAGVPNGTFDDYRMALVEGSTNANTTIDTEFAKLKGDMFLRPESQQVPVGDQGNSTQGFTSQTGYGPGLNNETWLNRNGSLPNNPNTPTIPVTQDEGWDWGKIAQTTAVGAGVGGATGGGLEYLKAKKSLGKNEKLTPENKNNIKSSAMRGALVGSIAGPAFLPILPAHAGVVGGVTGGMLSMLAKEKKQSQEQNQTKDLLNQRKQLLDQKLPFEGKPQSFKDVILQATLVAKQKNGISVTRFTQKLGIDNTKALAILGKIDATTKQALGIKEDNYSKPLYDSLNRLNATPNKTYSESPQFQHDMKLAQAMFGIMGGVIPAVAPEVIATNTEVLEAQHDAQLDRVIKFNGQEISLFDYLQKVCIEADSNFIPSTEIVSQINRIAGSNNEALAKSILDLMEFPSPENTAKLKQIGNVLGAEPVVVQAPTASPQQPTGTANQAENSAANAEQINQQFRTKMDQVVNGVIVRSAMENLLTSRDSNFLDKLATKLNINGTSIEKYDIALTALQNCLQAYTLNSPRTHALNVAVAFAEILANPGAIQSPQQPPAAEAAPTLEGQKQADITKINEVITNFKFEGTPLLDLTFNNIKKLTDLSTILFKDSGKNPKFGIDKFYLTLNNIKSDSAKLASLDSEKLRDYALFLTEITERVKAPQPAPEASPSPEAQLVQQEKQALAQLFNTKIPLSDKSLPLKEILNNDEEWLKLSSKIDTIYPGSMSGIIRGNLKTGLSLTENSSNNVTAVNLKQWQEYVESIFKGMGISIPNNTVSPQPEAAPTGTPSPRPEPVVITPESGRTKRRSGAEGGDPSEVLRTTTATLEVSSTPETAPDEFTKSLNKTKESLAKYEGYQATLSKIEELAKQNTAENKTLDDERKYAAFEICKDGDYKEDIKNLIKRKLQTRNWNSDQVDSAVEAILSGDSNNWETSGKTAVGEIKFAIGGMLLKEVNHRKEEEYKFTQNNSIKVIEDPKLIELADSYGNPLGGDISKLYGAFPGENKEDINLALNCIENIEIPTEEKQLVLMLQVIDRINSLSKKPEAPTVQAPDVEAITSATEFEQLPEVLPIPEENNSKINRAPVTSSAQIA